MSEFQYIPGVSIHARERMIERFGADLSFTQWLDVVSKIVNRQAVLVSSDINGKECWLLEIGGLRIWAVWSPEAAVVATIMDPSVMAMTRSIQRTKGTKLRIGPGPMERGHRTRAKRAVMK